MDPCLYDSSGSDFDSLTFLTNFADLDLFRGLSIPSISYCEDSQNVKLNLKTETIRIQNSLNRLFKNVKHEIMLVEAR